MKIHFEREGNNWHEVKDIMSSVVEISHIPVPAVEMAHGHSKASTGF